MKEQSDKQGRHIFKRALILQLKNGIKKLELFKTRSDVDFYHGTLNDEFETKPEPPNYKFWAFLGHQTWRSTMRTSWIKRFTKWGLNWLKVNAFCDLYWQTDSKSNNGTVLDEHLYELYRGTISEKPTLTQLYWYLSKTLNAAIILATKTKPDRSRLQKGFCRWTDMTCTKMLSLNWLTNLRFAVTSCIL